MNIIIKHIVLKIQIFLIEYFTPLKNISFLNNTYEHYENKCFIGTTMWSKITNPINEINDVYQIPNFDYIKYNFLNMICVDFLEDTVEKMINVLLHIIFLLIL